MNVNNNVNKDKFNYPEVENCLYRRRICAQGGGWIKVS